MIFRYSKNMDTNVKKQLVKYESNIKTMAKRMRLNHERIIIDYTKDKKYFIQKMGKGYPDIEMGHGFIGISGKDLVFYINSNFINAYTLAFAQEGVTIHEFIDYKAKTYALVAVRMIIRQALEMDNDFAGLVESITEDPLDMAFELYTVSRFVWGAEESSELIKVVYDPYSYLGADIRIETVWMDLFSSVAYHTYKCKNSKKHFGML